MHLRLIIDVVYDEATISELDAEYYLLKAAGHIAAEGLLTGDSSGVIDEYNYRVEKPCGKS